MRKEELLGKDNCKLEFEPLYNVDERRGQFMSVRKCLRLTALLVALPVTGFATAIDVQTLTQLMIEDQALDTTLLALALGNGPISPITFSSNINLSAMSYSFTFLPVPGSMYGGQSLTLVATGVFDSTTSIMTVNSSVTLGPTTYTIVGTTAVDLLDSPETATENDTVGPPIPTPYAQPADGVHLHETFNSDGTSTGTLTLTLHGVDLAGAPVGTSRDSYDSATGRWSYSQDLGNVGVTSVGFSFPTGGTGNFTTTVSAVPEPSSITLFGLSISVLLAVKTRGRRNLL